jgi:hypothetical protein
MRLRLLSLSLAVFIVGSAIAQYGDIGDLKLLKPADKVDVKSTPAPKGAIVLFDGKSLDGWVSRNGGKAKWKLLPGGVMQSGGGDIHTEQKFDGKFKLHVEFRVPYFPKKSGQGRGNSGVYLQGRYEVQILDSYGLKSKDNDCGGIYGVAAPKSNECKAPTVWQSYDIEFASPKFDGKKKVSPAKITIVHNGVKIHDGVEIKLDNTTSGMGGDTSKPGPIMLQDHGDPVQFRNIWLLPMKDEATRTKE